ncbi:YihY/virulence factor BrkB family protein [Flavobacterium sp. xlx-214]|uniref:YihY/virulence factor BrkB family protein n=1 Tax=unclassified Flavobacterium TaxID=196869 RepID=UPI0013D7FC6F|nr:MULTISPECIES: YihY/virulence factor BrkB family protein [unclassified Flavobacterium]MBA5791350.1 YihY/virulence factor BrkB family protein [Flavobacterium sp. xlx-221]QMI83495.1 YihY/virulence factor BrkB family protein [Flavobacterium sp. xlx-214]
MRLKLPGLEGLTLYGLLRIYIEGIVKGAFNYKAGSIAFTFFMALFPFALFLLNLIPYIPIDNFQQSFLSFVEENVPPNTYDAIELILVDIMNNSYKSLLSTGVIMSVIFMANGVNAIIGGFESSTHLSVSRSFFRQYLISIVLSVLLSLLLVISVAVYLTVEVLMHVSDNPVLADVGRNIFVVLMILLTVSILYKFGTKETKHLSFISYGSIFTTILMSMTSVGFGFYVSKFAKYNELYGSIGTLLVIMIYIWINCMILLLGFELNAAIYTAKRKKMYISNTKTQN